LQAEKVVTVGWDIDFVDDLVVFDYNVVQFDAKLETEIIEWVVYKKE
jgi:hypothetical protein